MFHVQTYRRPSACAIWFDVVDYRAFSTEADAREAARLVATMMEELNHDRDMWSVDVMDESGRVVHTWGFNVWGE